MKKKEIITSEKKAIGEDIKMLRKSVGWTQDELARKTEEAGHGISKSAITKIERGVHRPGKKHLISLLTPIKNSIKFMNLSKIQSDFVREVLAETAAPPPVTPEMELKLLDVDGAFSHHNHLCDSTAAYFRNLVPYDDYDFSGPWEDFIQALIKTVGVLRSINQPVQAVETRLNQIGNILAVMSFNNAVKWMDDQDNIPPQLKAACLIKHPGVKYKNVLHISESMEKILDHNWEAILNHISETVRRLRQEQGMSQKAMADKAGFDPARVSCFENKKYVGIPCRVFNQIVLHLDINTDILLEMVADNAK